MPAVAEDLVVRLYHVTSTCVLATPAYLRRHGTPQTPADLVRHTGLLLRTVNLNPVRRLYRDGIESEILEWKNVFITHDQIALKELLLEDRGIAVDLSLAHVVEELESGRIVSVMPGWERAPWRMCVVTLREREEACPPLRLFAEAVALRTGEDWIAYTERGRAAIARAGTPEQTTDHDRPRTVEKNWGPLFRTGPVPTPPVRIDSHPDRKKLLQSADAY